MKELKFINKSQLEHHPENPRKQIGDIEELTASIKIDGILQNLTIVPKPDADNKYYIVIGNRRFEAGIAAGVENFPCVISDMDHAKQIETMLIENINRSALTVMEEAEGFQQLSLFGYSVNEIVEKTGFSESTVRKRLKLAEYDKKKVTEAVERGATLEEFAKLDKIKLKSDKKKLLSLVGTNNFNNEYNKIIKFQSAKEKAIKIASELNKFAKPVKENEDTWKSCWHRVYSDSIIDFDIEKCKKKCKGKKDYYYKIYLSEYNNSCYVYYYEKESSVSISKPKKSDLERQFDRAKRFVNKTAKEHYQLRMEFLQKLVNLKTFKDYEKICFNCLNEICNMYGSIGGNQNTTAQLFKKTGIPEPKIDEHYFYQFSKKFREHSKESPAGHAILITYAHLNDSDDKTCFESFFGNLSNKTNFYRKNELLQRIYDFLLNIGYEPSDEEIQIMNGAHPIYDAIKGEEFLAELKKRG